MQHTHHTHARARKDVSATDAEPVIERTCDVSAMRDATACNNGTARSHWDAQASAKRLYAQLFSWTEGKPVSVRGTWLASPGTCQ